MKLYASWTGTKKNLRALRNNGWSLLMSPDTLFRCKNKTAPLWPDGTAAPYVLDNGAWGCHQREEPFNETAFLWAYDRIAANAEWVVAPDIVGGGLDSLSLTKTWLPKLDHKKVLIAVQDGMTSEHVDPLMDLNRGIFLGGTTEYKMSSMMDWGKYCAAKNIYFHVARVNTIKRFRACQAAGADSIDGSGASRFACTASLLPDAAKQQSLFGRKQ
jgi:hypothetical protein